MGGDWTCEREGCTNPRARRANARYCGSTCRALASKERREKRSQAQPRPSTALTSALTKALKDGDRQPADGAAVSLARLYARQLDAEPAEAARLGPKYLDVLVQLRMTPGSRGAKGVQPGGDSPARQRLNQLRDEVAERRAARQHAS